MSDGTDVATGTDVAAGNGAGGAVPVTRFDDPHLLPYAKNPRRAEMLIGLLLLLGLAGFAAYGALYWVGGQTQWEGVFGGIGFFAFGFGLSAWGKYLLPQGPFVEERHELASSEVEVGAMAAAIEDRGKMVFRRRGFLGTILGAGAGVMGVVITFPLVRSLGPPPKKSLDTTNWTKGAVPRRHQQQAHPPGRPRGGRGAHGLPRGIRRHLGQPDHADPPGPHRHRHRHPAGA